MSIFRSVVLVSIAATPALLAASSNAAPRAGATVDAVPVAKLTARISPHGKRLPRGTPIAFALDTRFTSDPPGQSFVLRRLDYLFPRGTIVNGRLFPSCRVRALRRSRGRPRSCPKGSRIGRGTVLGNAVQIGVTSRAKLTLFNGPGGRSITMNVSVKTPALLDTTISARLRRLKGRHADKLTFALPTELKKILGGDIATTRIHLAIGATRIVHGVKRGYVEVERCSRSGRARLHGDFRFEHGSRASADSTVAC